MSKLLVCGGLGLGKRGNKSQSAKFRSISRAVYAPEYFPGLE